MIYIASPYSHSDPEIVVSRFREALSYTTHLLRSRQWCYSPIVHCHELASTYSLPTDASYWREYNEHMINISSEVHILALTGWRKSFGVGHEIFRAYRRELPVRFINPTTYREASEAQL